MLSKEGLAIIKLLLGFGGRLKSHPFAFNEETKVVSVFDST